MSFETMKVVTIHFTSPGYHPVYAKSFLDQIVGLDFLLSPWFHHFCGPVGTSQMLLSGSSLSVCPSVTVISFCGL